MKRTKHKKKDLIPYNKRELYPTNRPLELSYNISLQESLFVTEYTKDWDVLRALKDSGLYPTKTTQKEAIHQGYELLKKPAITAAIGQAVEYKKQRNLISTDQIIVHMARIAFADISECYNIDGTIKDIDEIPYELRCCISEIKSKTLFGKDKDDNIIVRGHIKELKLESKLKALQELMKQLTPQIPDTVINQTNNIQNNIDLSNATAEDIKVLLRLTGKQTETNDDIIELEKIEECSLNQ
jgi:hypothetical protein